MKTIKNHTGRIRAHLKNSLAQSSFQQANIFKSRGRQIKENRTMMEMWEHYLTFTKLEF